jgi:hypothetical protein
MRRQRVTITAARTGGASLIAGSLLLAAYAILFTVLLPVPRTPVEYAQVVLNPAWRPLALLAFAGVLLMIPGLFAVCLAIVGAFVQIDARERIYRG